MAGRGYGLNINCLYTNASLVVSDVCWLPKWSLGFPWQRWYFLGIPSLTELCMHSRPLKCALANLPHILLFWLYWLGSSEFFEHSEPCLLSSHFPLLFTPYLCSSHFSTSHFNSLCTHVCMRRGSCLSHHSLWTCWILPLYVLQCGAAWGIPSGVSSWTSPHG